MRSNEQWKGRPPGSTVEVIAADVEIGYTNRTLSSHS